MKRMASHSIGVDQGALVLFSDFQDGGAMWTGSGPRELRRDVTFGQAFKSAPAVQVTLAMWDMDQKTNQRADISADGITESGFTIVFRTWGDTRVARVRADWLAIGEARDDEDWDIP